MQTTRKLSKAPINSKPQYFVEVTDAKGESRYCADPKAMRSLLALMDLGAVNGGAACHWGGPSAIAESMAALHELMFRKEDWFEYYNFVNDIGHAENGIYALRALYNFGGLSNEDLKGFRSFGTKLTGHGESHLYPEGVLLSNGPLGSALPQAQGLAMSDKLIGNKRTTVTVISDGACMEGEAKEALAAIPGLHKNGKINPFLLIISDNQTKLSGRMGDAFSMTPTFNSLEALGWNVIYEPEGNDLQACYSSLEKALAKLKDGPTCLQLKTVKGYGIKETEMSSSGGHGFPLKAYDKKIFDYLKEIWGGEVPREYVTWAEELTTKPSEASKAPSTITSEKMQVGISKAAINCRREGLPVVSLSSDLQGSTGMAPFHKEFPEFSYDMGIAESNMVSAAAGFSKNGFVAIVDTFAAFGVTKGNLPLIMSSLSECPVIAVFSHTGFQDAADGASHQSLTYFSAVCSIPNTQVIAVSCSREAEIFLEKAIKEQHSLRLTGGHAPSYIFFVGRENFPAYFESTASELARWNADCLIAEGKDVLIAATGPLVHQALAAKEILASKGISAGVVHRRFLNSTEVNDYDQWLNDHGKRLVTVEDHQLKGGIGSFLISEITKNSPKSLDKVLSLGVRGEFGQSSYTAVELYRKHGLSADKIAESVEKLLAD
ncbi:MAG: transketolase [Halobacteriovoraceae bacterium]|nr:transketolase [Halobacteriovoraceae bacterium]